MRLGHWVALCMFLDSIGHCVCLLTILSIVYVVVESWCGVICVDVIHGKPSVRSKTLVGRSAGRGTTHGGSQAGAHQTRAQADPQPKVVNGGQPRVVAQERVQEQVVQDTPLTVPTVDLPADVVIKLLNVLETLVANNGGLPVPQTTSQTQTQVQLNVAATQTPQLTP
ncbi:hypothetical protein HAX54_046862 [Datura stramonium]|uniref:Uncharacterized protein n=1 Tax=Datura stramonium TaxID=4076 RepID=A0ABS8WLF7_DATST|nr:hypothetical protein [Datura stramonium]